MKLDVSLYFDDPQQQQLADAAQRGQVERVRDLLRSGANPDAEGHHGFRPIFFAVGAKDAKTLALLLEQGASAHVQLENGNTPLLFAVRLKNSQFTRLLLQAGANPNARGENDKTILYEAGYAGEIENIRLLVKAGAEVDGEWADATPMISAFMRNKWALAREFLALGADPKKRDSRGMDSVAWFCDSVAEINAPSKKIDQDLQATREAFKEHGIDVPC